jgi:hypothetical protein
MFPEYQIVSATGTYEATGTFNFSPNWEASIATFKGGPSKGTPSFSNLSAPTIPYGTATTTISGNLGSSAPFPTGSVSITLNSVTKSATLQSDGSFSTSFDTSALPVQSGGYTISYSYAGDNNYSSATGSSTLTVTKASSTTTVSDAGGPYKGSPYTASAEAKGPGSLDDTNPADFTFSYVGTGTTSYGPSATAPTNPGTYSVTATYNGDANHTGSIGSASFNIGKATPTVNVTGGTFAYNGQPHPATGSVVGVNNTNLGTPTITYTAVTGDVVPVPVNVGTYSVLASFAGNANYNAASATATIVITGTYTAPQAAPYWQNHPFAWPVTTLTLGGFSYSQQELLAILNEPSGPDAAIILAQQLIAAKLNILDGSNPTPIILSTISNANNLLATLGQKLSLTTTNVKKNTTLGKAMLADASELNLYNEGK